MKELQRTEVSKGNNEMSPAQKRKRQSPTSARKKWKQHEETSKRNEGMTEVVANSTSTVGQDVTESPRRTEGSECAGKGVTSATHKTKGKSHFVYTRDIFEVFSLVGKQEKGPLIMIFFKISMS